MKKDKFNKLDISDQVKYINTLLAKDYTLTKACELINIHRSTIRSRFLKYNYILNTEINRYEFKDNNKHESFKTTTNNNNNINDVSNEDPNIINILIKQYAELKERIEVLESIQSKKISVNTRVPGLQRYEGKEVVRSFRINEDIQKEFKNFCSANMNSYIRQSDIISLAIDEFLKKYNKK